MPEGGKALVYFFLRRIGFGSRNGGGNIIGFFPIVAQEIFEVGPSKGGGGVFGRGGVVEIGPHTSGVMRCCHVLLVGFTRCNF